MARSGRPRKVKSSREPNGRSQRSQLIEARESLAHKLFIRRGLLQQGVEVKDLLDPICGDPLGVYLKTKRISKGQYNAGIRYRTTALCYRKLGGFSSGFPKLLGVKGLDLSEAPSEVWEAVKQRYHLYRSLIIERAGRLALQAVHEVCVVERPVDGDLLEPLSAGLYALTRGRKFPARADTRLTLALMRA